MGRARPRLQRARGRRGLPRRGHRPRTRFPHPALRRGSLRRGRWRLALLGGAGGLQARHRRLRVRRGHPGHHRRRPAHERRHSRRVDRAACRFRHHLPAGPRSGPAPRRRDRVGLSRELLCGGRGDSGMRAGRRGRRSLSGARQDGGQPRPAQGLPAAFRTHLRQRVQEPRRSLGRPSHRGGGMQGRRGGGRPRVRCARQLHRESRRCFGRRRARAHGAGTRGGARECRYRAGARGAPAGV